VFHANQDWPSIFALHLLCMVEDVVKHVFIKEYYDSFVTEFASSFDEVSDCVVVFDKEVRSEFLEVRLDRLERQVVDAHQHHYRSHIWCRLTEEFFGVCIWRRLNHRERTFMYRHLAWLDDRFSRVQTDREPGALTLSLRLLSQLTVHELDHLPRDPQAETCPSKLLRNAIVRLLERSK